VHVTDVVLVRSVSATTPAVLSLLEAGVSFSIIGRAGCSASLCRARGDIPQDDIQKISEAIRQAEQAPDLTGLRGHEGAGARAYFRIFRAALQADWTFEKRSRRPPADPANVLLRVGYCLLTQNMMTALEVAGLDPYDGLFHVAVYGGPALVLDLVEEFRALIVPRSSGDRGLGGPNSDQQPHPFARGF